MSMGTNGLLIDLSTSELNALLNPTAYLKYTGCWIQQVTAPTMAVTCWIQQVAAPTVAVTCWIQQPTCILRSSWTGGRLQNKTKQGVLRPPVQVDGKMHAHC